MGGLTETFAIFQLKESLRRVLAGLVAHKIIFFFPKVQLGGPTSNPSSVSAARTSSSRCDQDDYNAVLIFSQRKSPFGSGTAGRSVLTY